MASPPNLVQISFAGGVDESMTDEVLDPSTAFRVLENTRQDYQGGANKRLGFGSKTLNRFSGSRSSGARLTAYRGTPVVIDSSATLDVYDSVLALNNNRGSVCECTSDDVPLPRGRNQSVVQDIAIANGIVMTAYRNYAEVAIANASTGAAISNPSITEVATGTTYRIRLAAFSDRYIAVFFQETVTGNIDLKVYDTTMNTFGAVVAVSAGAVVDSFSVASVSDRAIVVFGSGANLAIKTYNAAGVIATASVGVTVTETAVDVIGTTAWVASVQAGSVYAASYDTTSLAAIAAMSAALITPSLGVRRIDIVAKTDTTKARVFMFDTVTATGTSLVFQNVKTTTGTATADGSAETVHGAMPDSRMFRHGSKIYMAVHGSPFDSSFFGSGTQQRVLTVVDCTDASSQTLRPVAHIDPGLVHFNEATSKWATDADGRLCFAYGVIVRAVSSTDFGTSVDVAAVKMVRLDFGNFYRWQSAEHDGTLFFGGACTYTFDGDAACEAGFCASPVKPVLSDAAGSIAAGTYNYVAIYEDIGSDGKVAYSGVSVPETIIPAIPSDITIKVPPLTVTQRASRPGLRLAIYRTVSGGAPPYYRVGSVQNDPSQGLLSYVDTTTDAVLSSQSQLYAPNLPGVDGDKLDRRAPPGLNTVVSYNGFLCGARGQSIFGSGQAVYGEATWFSPVFETPVPDGGPITALVPQDGTLYAFKRTSVLALNGEPPSDNASSGGLGPPRKLSSELGCINPRSVAVTSIGIFFQSDRGIELLDRGGNVTFIGQKVQRTLADYPIVTSAVVDTRNSLVRFSLAASTTDGIVDVDGRDVVYDLQLNVWTSVDRKTGQSADEASQDACVVLADGVWRYAWLGRDGYLYTEKLASDSDAHLDGSTWVARAAETGSFKTGGIQGQQAVSWVQLLERKTTDHDAAIALAYNYDSSFQAPTTWTSPVINDVLSNGWPITQLRHQPHDESQPCQGIRVRMTDATPTSGTVGSGAASTWIALSLDITPKPGLFEVPEELT